MSAYLHRAQHASGASPSPIAGHAPLELLGRLRLRRARHRASTARIRSSGNTARRSSSADRARRAARFGLDDARSTSCRPTPRPRHASRPRSIAATRIGRSTSRGPTTPTIAPSASATRSPPSASRDTVGRQVCSLRAARDSMQVVGVAARMLRRRSLSMSSFLRISARRRQQSGPQHAPPRRQLAPGGAGRAGFVARTNALMNLPSICAASVAGSSPLPARNAAASSAS